MVIEVLNGLKAPFSRPGVVPAVCGTPQPSPATLQTARQSQMAYSAPALHTMNVQMQFPQQQQQQQQNILSSVPQLQSQKQQVVISNQKSQIKPLLNELESFENVKIFEEFDLNQKFTFFKIILLFILVLF